MTTLDDVVADLRDEQDTLDALLGGLSDDQWSTATPAEGWDVRDTIAHLADTDDFMFESVTENFLPERAGLQINGVDDFTAIQVEKGRTMSPRDVHGWWRSATARNRDHIAHLDPSKRYPWGGNQLSPLSLASARLMETWAHSLDCHGAFGKQLADSDRLRHIAHLGLRALPYAFTVAGVRAPGPVRLELDAPNGQTWTFGPDDAPTVIRGAAADWCAVTAHRDRDGARDRLRAEGPDGDNVLTHARAFL